MIFFIYMWVNFFFFKYFHSPKVLHHHLTFSTKTKTYHDVIPISCLTEFPNVVQMAKVGHYHHAELIIKLYSKLIKQIVVFMTLQLVCEEVNVDRFYPVLYPKVAVFFFLLVPVIHQHCIIMSTSVNSLFFHP